ncbi:proenkephalin-A-like [Brienomyrus brachyistius]|uniref:proenkephalin-A-like n=1 Tax=Brienomyrus brachyistius TaxID=42636 RepID=UPI0020B3FF45|nr:proenkephalin-A-like [Brienomyrus brachyistius]
MGLTVKACWTLILSTCLAQTVSADCSQDCALCLFRLQGRPAEMSTLTCTLECEGKLTTRKSIDLCKDILQAERGRVGEEGPTKQEDDERQLEKKYGGFLKRYGGFMKKAGEPVTGPEDENGSRDGLVKRYGGFMKKDAEAGGDGVGDLKELLNPEAALKDDQQVAKRYGGFMRNVDRSSELDGEARELQKRYGGFMRRMGRPAWKEDEKRLIGFLERPRGDEGGAYSPAAQKRYGGFMD